MKEKAYTRLRKGGISFEILRFNLRQSAVRLGCWILLASACAALGEEAPVVRPSPADLLPRATIVSSDNAFEISAASSSMGFRGPVLFFVGQFRKEFLHSVQLDPGRVGHPILIRLGSSTNDLRVIGSFAPGVAGGEREWIEMPDPGHADLDLLRTALAQAILREWRRTLPGAPGPKPLQDPPAWLLAGIARHVGAEHRLEDLDGVHTQWQHGRLPSLAELLSTEPPAALQHPAMQAVLAAWLLEHPGGTVGAVLRRLAEGTPWSPELVAETMHAQKSIGGLGEDWDAWQVNAMREVRQVGVTTPGMVRAFRSQLLLYPGDSGLLVADSWRGRTFEECLALPATPEVRKALRDKAAAIRAFSAGRDGALQRVAVAYETVFDALAAGEASGKLRAMLAQAEAERRQLEERAEKGEMLHDPVAEAIPAAKAMPVRRK